ncbi:unnamed protein product [Linum trigynum]|uniref:SWIM-type domain-containing protein n=1 Tax=Linum trigynum TaxID=586398 RepID=A0AAV2GYF4_9ROSI
MANAIASMLIQCAFDGCSVSISIHDTVIEKRPYHKNCKCALHKQKGNCSHTRSTQRNVVSFPKKTGGGSLAMTVSSNSSIRSHSSSLHVASESSGDRNQRVSELCRENNRGEVKLAR